MVSLAPDIYDLTIIGGGPTGLFGAFYAGLRHLKTKIIDALPELGGQLTALYPEKYIYDVAGFPKVLARDLAKALIEQAMHHHPTLNLGETVQTLERVEDLGCYRITSDKTTHYTKTVLISAGAGAFQPKKLPFPGANLFEDRGVYYFVRSKAAFQDKWVLIVGGGDSAMDWALNLQGTAKHVTIIHRRNQFRAHEETVQKVLAAGTQILTFWEMKALDITDNQLTGAVIVNNQTGEERKLAVEAILVQVGFLSSLGPMKDWPLKFERTSVAVNSRMETSLPGVFAAGDMASYDGKLKLIATGFGEAAMAVNFAKTFLDPTAKAFPGHSSEMTPQKVVTL